ncbi:MAG TPA: helix-turn-helix transcriptional regulator [Acidimicrobiales bacterium]|nr:helix-turn-helix transcriptional regulator [Acidimicrobiales bacterium]
MQTRLKPSQTSRLREWRIAHDLTLEEQADLTGASISMLSLAERGLRNLSWPMKVKIARRLGVPIRELFEVEELEDEAVGE